MKLNNIEFRWSDVNQMWELLEWFERKNDKPYCCVIAFFDFNKESVYMESVGLRYVNCKDQKALHIVAKNAMNFLQDKFEYEKRTQKV